MMLNVAKDKLFLVLVALLGITMVSWLFISSANLEEKSLGVVILLLAFFKVRLIAIHFMETAMAHRLVRIAFETWGAVVGGMMILGYLMG
ncbi:hypothetical protein A9Q99_21935 [Gammaproteobacteria bacterium 45_16_T64]|nr:hypothetical protein A9Q99_21935 [Gammaproteobacteria bacterium 45_16_T64]